MARLRGHAIHVAWWRSNSAGMRSAPDMVEVLVPIFMGGTTQRRGLVPDFRSVELTYLALDVPLVPVYLEEALRQRDRLLH